jgi:hypothetical protein
VSEGYQAFARERSHQDVKTSAEYGKTLIQLIIGANGVAITALLTLAGSQKDVGLARSFMAPVIIYSLGVWLGLLSARSYYIASRDFATRWEHESYGSNKEEADRHFRFGVRGLRRGDICVQLGILFFILGGIVTVFVLSFPNLIETLKATFRHEG